MLALLQAIGEILDDPMLLPVQKYDRVKALYYKARNMRCEKCGGHGYVKACKACEGTGIVNK